MSLFDFLQIWYEIQQVCRVKLFPKLVFVTFPVVNKTLIKFLRYWISQLIYFQPVLLNQNLLNVIRKFNQVVLINRPFLTIDLFTDKWKSFFDLLGVSFKKVVLKSLGKFIFAGSFHQQISHVFTFLKTILLDPFVYFFLSVTYFFKFINFFVNFID